MSFKNLQIRYQTARSLPAPYAYFYTLAARPTPTGALQVDLAITYPDREDIDDDELIAEGYTRDDDVSWSGQLPKIWLQTLADLADKTRLQALDEEQLGEDDDFWDVRVETDEASPKAGRPANRGQGSTDDWQYLVQELIQATYEAAGRERPFELTFLDLGRQQMFELQLTASFVERTVTIQTLHDQQKRTKTLSWATLQRVMSEVYNHDYDPDEAQQKRPRGEGQWLNLGTEEWHDVSTLSALTKMFRNL